MEFTHELAAGMGGMRTAGDLVARLQLSKAMKIQEAKVICCACSIAAFSI